jgi:hypothetical protein
VGGREIKEGYVSLHAFAKRHRKTFAVTELGLLVAAIAMLATIVVLLTFAGLVHAALG